eukprot:TRINITY_DN5831_c0_g1_i2.p1 TRINITY_DN5831_c0_g1~~TRINITY_DN5831_c0_g1_i2.p1  ORF type:complete len:451 (+),score=158.81 TRINITY_DN5831_c0_g1_i2:152-1504(+)
MCIRDRLRKAQEQMANMSPDQLRMMQQQMANMDPATLNAMAAQMGGVPPGVDMAAAARKMQSMSPDELTRAQEEMKNMSGSELEAKQKQINDQVKYARDCAKRAKDEGNQLFRAGKLSQAVEKYDRAAESLAMDATVEGQEIVRQCRTNAAACLLKQEDWEEAEERCDEVLEADPCHLKALFRRGQARIGLGMRADALEDLREASKVSSEEDPNILAAIAKAEALPENPVLEESSAEDRASWEGKSISELRKELIRRGVDCSQCTEKTELVDLVCSGKRGEKKKTKQKPSKPASASSAISTGAGTISAEQMQTMQEQMKQNPEMMKQAASKMANMSEEEIARMSEMTGQKFDPAMAKTAAAMMENMSPEQMAQQMEMARQMQAGGTNSTGMPAGAPAMTPEMAAMAGDMMKGMSSEDMKNMMDMSRKMQENGGQPSMACLLYTSPSPRDS